MSAEGGVDREPRLLFTAPWEPVVVRRGDALGLRAFADQLADALAPDLSNRVRDGRWVTILAWCLVRSHAAFHAGGGRSVATRAEQRERYAWLRPLELMWIARTIALAKDWKDRPLAGQRRLKPWYESYKNAGRLPDRFGMSIDQFRAYRQTGMYGGYRVAFRRWPCMTVSGDGWTPAQATHSLAKWLDERLGAARPWSLHVGEGDDESVSRRSARLAHGNEHGWWLRQWEMFERRSRNAEALTLPRRKDDFDVLPERDLLKPLVFGSDPPGERRLKVAREASRVAGVRHIDICKHLAQVFCTDTTIALIPRFSRLADAGMEAMDLVAQALAGQSRVALTSVAATSSAAAVCAKLRAAATEWRTHPAMQPRHIETAHRFATAIGRSARPLECLQALLQYHEVYGGGLRWFVLRNNWVEPRTPPRAGSSRYRFRLWSLCRLGTQCGVLRRMPLALRGGGQTDEDVSWEEGNE